LLYVYKSDNGRSELEEMAHAYDEGAIRAELRSWWDGQVDSADDPFAAPKPTSGTIFDVIPVVDSLSVVTALVAIEKHVGFKVPSRVIQRGGYNSFDEMVDDLVPKVSALFERRKPAGRKQERKPNDGCQR
jgi:hypothetical protein